MKEIVILASPNGAGKTTAARKLLPKFPNIREFLNADEFARAISPEFCKSSIRAVGKIGRGFAMRSMTSREIHNAIRVALGEVSRALASGELDRSGRYYSDSELKERFASRAPRQSRRLLRDRKIPSRTPKSARIG